MVNRLTECILEKHLQIFAIQIDCVNDDKELHASFRKLH